MSVVIIIDFDTFASVHDLGRCSCTAFVQMVANTSPMSNITHNTVLVVAIWVQDQEPFFTGVEELRFVSVCCWNREMVSLWANKLWRCLGKLLGKWAKINWIYFYEAFYCGSNRLLKYQIIHQQFNKFSTKVEFFYMFKYCHLCEVRLAAFFSWMRRILLLFSARMQFWCRFGHNHFIAPNKFRCYRSIATS